MRTLPLSLFTWLLSSWMTFAYNVVSRRQVFTRACSAALVATAATLPSHAATTSPDEVFNVDDYLRTGLVSQPMGVSGQAGKSKPETGILLVDGTELSQAKSTGQVSAEILVNANSDNNNNNNNKVPVLASFEAPWNLATGTVFDVECRNQNGDSTFLSVSQAPLTVNSLDQVPDSFLLNELTRPTSRFSFYGPPTDLKVKSSKMIKNNRYKLLEISFSTLSQSTQTELPRLAQIVATLPESTHQVVFLTTSASSTRYKKQQDTISKISDSFVALPAPQSQLRLKAKERLRS